MRKFFIADLRLHILRILVMFIIPTLLLLYFGPGGSGMLGFILFTFVVLLLPLVLMIREERMGGVELMVGLPTTRTTYMLRRLTTLWFWFALVYIWVQLMTAAGALIHGHDLHITFNLRLLALSIFLFGAFNGVMLPLAYRFSATAVLSLANGVIFGFGLTAFVMARNKSGDPFGKIELFATNLNQAFDVAVLSVLLIVVGLAVFAAGGWLCVRIFAKKDL